MIVRNSMIRFFLFLMILTVSAAVFFFLSADKANAESSTDEEFETYMTEQGFPDSYKPYLRTLHKAHPKWVFVAQKTGVKWSDAVSAESVVGENLVESSFPESWKGMVSGAYTFKTKTYRNFDGRWNQASVPVIKYYLDPRNGLNETNIYEFMTHAFDSAYQTKKTIKGITSYGSNCFMNNSTYYKALYNAGKGAKVNPNVITAIVVQEQGWKGSSSVSGTVKGYKGIYNHWNIMAYTTSGMTAVQHGLWWAAGAGSGETSYGRPWNTITKSLKGGAKFYKSQYINNSQNTFYLKKFNVMNGKSKLSSHQYCTNVQAGMAEGQLVRHAYTADSDYAIKFLIPVYTDMPEKTCKRPGTTGNNDCYLTALAVTGYKISPSFSAFKTSYKLTVPKDVATVKVTAKKHYSKAVVTGTGNVSLAAGKNVVKVKVKATSGMTKTYKITITREQ